MWKISTLLIVFITSQIYAMNQELNIVPITLNHEITFGMLGLLGDIQSNHIASDNQELRTIAYEIYAEHKNQYWGYIRSLFPDKQQAISDFLEDDYHIQADEDYTKYCTRQVEKFQAIVGDKFSLLEQIAYRSLILRQLDVLRAARQEIISTKLNTLMQQYPWLKHLPLPYVQQAD